MGLSKGSTSSGTTIDARRTATNAIVTQLARQARSPTAATVAPENGSTKSESTPNYLILRATVAALGNREEPHTRLTTTLVLSALPNRLVVNPVLPSGSGRAPPTSPNSRGDEAT
jgi:hypothetical protein